MQITTLFLTFTTLATAALNTTTEYKLKTQLLAGQDDKTEYDSLWLSSYHTGAGLNDVVFTNNQTSGELAFLNATNTTGSNRQYSNQLFDLGNEFAWGLEMAPNTEFYAAWQPVRMNAGASGTGQVVDGFFLNETGLQWTETPATPGGSTDMFGGWLVCDWWHGAPQLFFRISYYGKSAYPAPASCADVILIPEYI